jgi:hypothetical protein
MAITCFEPGNGVFRKSNWKKIPSLSYRYFLPQNCQLFDFFSKSQNPLIPIFFKKPRTVGSSIL